MTRVRCPRSGWSARRPARAAEGPVGARLAPAAVLVYQDVGLAGDVVGEDRRVPVGGHQAEVPSGVARGGCRQSGTSLQDRPSGDCQRRWRPGLPPTANMLALGAGCRVGDGPRALRGLCVEREALRGLAPGKTVRGDPRGRLPAGPIRTPPTASRPVGQGRPGPSSPVPPMSRSDVMTWSPLPEGRSHAVTDGRPVDAVGGVPQRGGQPVAVDDGPPAKTPSAWTGCR